MVAQKVRISTVSPLHCHRKTSIFLSGWRLVIFFYKCSCARPRWVLGGSEQQEKTCSLSVCILLRIKYRGGTEWGLVLAPFSADVNRSVCLYTQLKGAMCIVWIVVMLRSGFLGVVTDLSHRQQTWEQGTARLITLLITWNPTTVYHTATLSFVTAPIWCVAKLQPDPELKTENSSFYKASDWSVLKHQRLTAELF